MQLTNKSIPFSYRNASNSKQLGQTQPFNNRLNITNQNLPDKTTITGGKTSIVSTEYVLAKGPPMNQLYEKSTDEDIYMDKQSPIGGESRYKYSLDVYKTSP